MLAPRCRVTGAAFFVCGVVAMASTRRPGDNTSRRVTRSPPPPPAPPLCPAPVDNNPRGAAIKRTGAVAGGGVAPGTRRGGSGATPLTPPRSGAIRRPQNSPAAPLNDRRSEKSLEPGCLQVWEHLRCRIIVAIDSRPSGLSPDGAAVHHRGVGWGRGTHLPTLTTRDSAGPRMGASGGTSWTPTVRSHNTTGPTQPFNSGPASADPAWDTARHRREPRSHLNRARPDI